MGIPFTILMGFLLTMTMGILFTITIGIQLTIYKAGHEEQEAYTRVALRDAGHGEDSDSEVRA